MTSDTAAPDAARLLADHDLAGLVVVDGDRRPVAVLPATRLLRHMLPHYVLDDPRLAHVEDELHADRMADRLAGRRVGALLAGEPAPLPIVDADATAIEIAGVMADTHSPVVAVTDGSMIGVVTTTRLLDHLVPTR